MMIITESFETKINQQLEPYQHTSIATIKYSILSLSLPSSCIFKSSYTNSVYIERVTKMKMIRMDINVTIFTHLFPYIHKIHLLTQIAILDFPSTLSGRRQLKKTSILATINVLHLYEFFALQAACLVASCCLMT